MTGTKTEHFGIGAKTKAAHAYRPIDHKTRSVMKLSKVLRIGLFAAAAVVFAGTLTVSDVKADEGGPEFCWKDSYGRGVGTVPSSCAPGQERIGLLCYDQCPAGMRRVGLDCHSVCPEGMRDDGLYCRKAEYGRGVGFAWQFGDGLNNAGMMGRCEQQHGRGNCEMNGAVAYPKCKSGYTNVGCCICRPTRPNCAALGLGDQVDLSCGKKIQLGNPKTGQCGSGNQKDAGLCYGACQAGYSGVGPVCWAEHPKGWVDCGMGAAKDSATCAKVVFGQVSSVAQMAIFVASLGTSGAGSSAVKGGESASKLEKLKQTYESMKKSWEAIKKTPEVERMIQAAKAAKTIKSVQTAENTLYTATTEEDMARAAAQIAAIIDPSGVSSTVAAYTYPKCSKYFQ